MSGFPALFNFRSTTAYVTDGVGETPARAYNDVDHESGDNYPVNRNGLSFGTLSPPISSTRDRSAAVDRRFAGMWFNEIVTTWTFRLDLKSHGMWLEAGNYLVRLANGEVNYARTTTVVCVDGVSNTTRFTSTGTTGGANQYLDATGVNRASPDAWVRDNVAQTVLVTGATPYLLFKIGDSVSSTTGFLAHLEVMAVQRERPPFAVRSFVAAAGGATPTLWAGGMV